MTTTVKIGENCMPIIGLGTWQASDEVIEKAVTVALELGYRHFDTAFNYNNEEAIGRALKEWIEKGGKREDLFITTKLPHIGMRPEDVPRFLNLSLNRLQLDYIDLYLIHLPFGFFCNNETLTPMVNDLGEYQIDPSTDHIAIWKGLEDEVEKGLIKNLGLSNFNTQQIENVHKNAKIKPTVLQVEVHAYFQQKKLREFCDTLGIVVTAYAPLGSPGAKQHFVTKYKYKPEHFPDILGLPLLSELATKYNKTSAQILLRHLIQQNIVIIPKSSNPERIRENCGVFDFELSPSEMEQLNALDKGDDGRIFNFLFWKGVEKHPRYPFKEVLDKLEIPS